MYCGDDVSAIVGDIGLDSSKFGYAGEDTPKVYAPSRVGYSQLPQDEDGKPAGAYVGNNAPQYFQKQWRNAGDELTLKAPYVWPHGQNEQDLHWDVVEELWQYAFDQLHVAPTEHPVMASVDSMMSKKVQSDYLEMMFEKFNVPCCYLAKDAVLNAFSLGRSSALVIQFGAGSTRMIPVYDGYVLSKGIQKSSFGGYTLNRLIAQEMRVSNFRKEFELDILQDLKDTLFCMPDRPYDEKFASALPKEKYELPDGKTIEVGVERFKIPELMMNPTRNSIMSDDKNLISIPTMFASLMSSCDPDIRRELLGQIITCGGGSSMTNLIPRLQYEFSLKVPSTFKLRFITPTPLERKFSEFIGGSILASLGSFQQLWISRKEYDEKGSALMVENRLS